MIWGARTGTATIWIRLAVDHLDLVGAVRCKALLCIGLHGIDHRLWIRFACAGFEFELRVGEDGHVGVNALTMVDQGRFDRGLVGAGDRGTKAVVRSQHAGGLFEVLGFWASRRLSTFSPLTSAV